MIIMLLIIGICLGLILLCIKVNTEDIWIPTLRFFLPFIIVAGLVGPLVASYDNYLDARTTYDEIQNNYRESIEMYEDKAVIKADALTDFRYEGYQENIADLIKDLREKTVGYNKTVIKKRIMKDNIFFSWYIVGPDKDMKLLKIKE